MAYFLNGQLKRISLFIQTFSFSQQCSVVSGHIYHSQIYPYAFIIWCLFLGQKAQFVKDVSFPQIDTTDSRKIPVKIPASFQAIEKLTLKFTWKCKEPRIDETTLKGKTKPEEWYYPILRFIIKLQKWRQCSNDVKTDN